MCSAQLHSCELKCYQPCQPCEERIKKMRICGHVDLVECSKDANELECQKPCTKQLDCGHKCGKKCFEPCGNCQEIVEKKSEICGHDIKTKCCEEPNRKKCKGICPLILPCGHKCQELCCKKCTEICKTLIDCPFKPACGHQFKIPCYKKDINNPYSYDLLKHCTEPCNVTLDCLHACTGNCGDCAQDRVHNICQQHCSKRLICGHVCSMFCADICRPCAKKCTYACVHFKCNKRCGEPCTVCTKPCERR